MAIRWLMKCFLAESMSTIHHFAVADPNEEFFYLVDVDAGRGYCGGKIDLVTRLAADLGWHFAFLLNVPAAIETRVPYAALFFNNFKLIQIQRSVLKYGVVIHFPSVITTFHSFPCFLLIFLFLVILCFRNVHVVKLFQFWWRSQSLCMYMWNLLVLLAVVVGTIWLVRVYKKENRTQLEKRKLFTLLHYPNDFFSLLWKIKILTNFRKKILSYYFFCNFLANLEISFGFHFWVLFHYHFFFFFRMEIFFISFLF